MDYVWKVLLQRKRQTPFVCITGGEPTIYEDLPIFIEQLKNQGFIVKLDTNGTNPEILKKCLPSCYFVAMDLKCRSLGYKQFLPKFSPIDPKILQKNLLLSVDLIMKSGLHYEFRTTLTPGISKEDIRYWAKKVRNCERYVLKPAIIDGKNTRYPLSTYIEYANILYSYGCKEVVYPLLN